MLPGFTGDGAGASHEPPKKSLSELIADLNERFGVSLGEQDLVRGPAEAAMADDPMMKAAALNNDLDAFGHVFDGPFEEKMIEQIEHNTKVFQKFADDPEFNAELKSIARRYAYESLRREVA